MMILSKLKNKILGIPNGISIFHTNIKHIKKDKIFNASLDSTLLNVKGRNKSVREQVGEAITTSIDPRIIYEIQNIHLISEWLGVVIEKYISYNGIKNVKTADVVRGWCNRIFENCEGKPHRHDDYGTTFVVALYYDVPKNSSDLVVIDDEDVLTSYKDYEKTKIKRIKVKEGMAICMNPEIVHAVSEHKSKLPRTCFIFNVNLK